MKVLDPPTWLPATLQLQNEQKYNTRQEARKYEKRRAAVRKANAKPFIAWDGEGYTRPDGVHVYTLLANSVGGHIASKDAEHPLTSSQCFEFILLTAKANPGVNHVWFAFGYDVNMMLGDVVHSELETLYERDGAWTYCASIQTHIMFRPKKTMALRKRALNRQTGKREYLYVKMDDVFTFFGTSFVTACDQYLGKDWPDRDLVIKGKSERATGFGSVDVLIYCQAELRALVLLMNELRSRLDYVDIHPRDWHGPGAIASKLLQMHNVRQYTADMPEVLDIPLRHSYAGGRFEVLRYGSTTQSVWRYDRRSAYPYAAANLPPASGTWKHRNVVKRVLPLSLYRVDWHCDYENERYPQPFHYRSDEGHVSFPPHVQGWYWSDEIIQASRLPYGQIDILEGFEFTPDDTVSKPFDFVRGLYEQRRALLAMVDEYGPKGHPAQMALKLAINSVYGKLIQQLGWFVDAKGNLHRPPYFNLFWASRITSVTRAALLQLVIDNDGFDDLVSFETDAIFSTRRWENVDIGTDLGQWEEAELHNLVYVQSGVYACEETPHVRGMSKIVWPTDEHGIQTADAVIQTFRNLIANRFDAYEYQLEAFVGLGTGLTQDMNQWRKWIKFDRRLQTMEPSLGINKRNHDPLSCECADNDDNQLDIWHRTRVWPSVYAAGLQRAYDIDWNKITREVFDPSEIDGWA